MTIWVNKCYKQIFRQFHRVQHRLIYIYICVCVCVYSLKSIAFLPVSQFVADEKNHTSLFCGQKKMGHQWLFARLCFILVCIHGAMSASKNISLRHRHLTFIAGSPCLFSTGTGLSFPFKLRCWDGTTPTYDMIYSTACNGRGGRASCPTEMCAVPSSNNGLNDFGCSFFGSTCAEATGNSAQRICGAFLFVIFLLNRNTRQSTE